MLFIAGEGNAITQIVFCDSDKKPESTEQWHAARQPFENVIEQLDAYFASKLQQFELDLKPKGTEFQLAVWRALEQIPFGETRSYIDIARAINNPQACRAVGMANNRNPITIVIPCHRVIGADGSLVGYGGGIERKIRLLEHEKADCVCHPQQGSLF